MAEWGIKVSQPNKNVNTCADKDLAFSSQWNCLKIYDRGEGEIIVPGKSGSSYYGQNELTLDHNLNYYPISFVILQLDSNWIYSPGWNSSLYFWHFTTSSQLRIRINNYTSSSKIIPFKYLILIEENA